MADQQAETLSGVAWTAVMMAQERAAESARADRIFDDPWARRIVDSAIRGSGEPPPAWLAEGKTLGDLAPGMAGYVPLRTAWLDERILDGVRAGAAQVVLLGAGLDTRAARLRLPGAVTVFALDQPAVLDLAGRVMAGAPMACATVPVPADLAGDWPGELARHGFDPRVPTVWVTEGVLMYLPDAAAARLLDGARDLSGTPARLLADLAHPNIHRNTLFAGGRETLNDNGSPIRSSVSDPISWYAEHGWDGHVADPAALAARCRRAVPAALDPAAAGGPTFLFTEAAAGRGTAENEPERTRQGLPNKSAIDHRMSVTVSGDYKVTLARNAAPVRAGRGLASTVTVVADCHGDGL